MSGNAPRLVTVATAASTLGCHPETLRRAIRTGRLAVYKIGGCQRLAPEHIAAYLEQSLCPANDQTDHFSKNTGAFGQSHGGKKDAAAEFRLGRQMNAALDRR